MSRLARVVIPGIPHHITQRGNRRQSVFFCEQDKQAYLNLLRQFGPPAGIQIWTYCLMDNHVHHIVVPETKQSLALAFGEVHRRYTRMINFREKWRGYLWQGRFSSYPLDERHLYAAVRYVEQNPVCAGIVRQAKNYKWSSARAHVDKCDDVIAKHFFLLDEIDDWQRYLAEPISDKERKLIEYHCRTGRPRGNKEFIARLEKLSGRPLKKAKPGPKQRN